MSRSWKLRFGFAVNEKLLFYAQEARPYSLGLLCTMVSFLCYSTLLSTEKPSWRIGYLLATAGAYYSHYGFASVALIQILHLFLTEGWSKLKSKSWIITFVVLTLVCLPGVAQGLLFIRRGGLDWVLEPDLFDPVRLAVDFLGRWPFFLGAATVLPFAILSREKMTPIYRGLDLAALWFLAPVMIVATGPFFGVSVFQDRFALSALPAGLFLLAWLLGLGKKNIWFRWAPLAVFLSAVFLTQLLPAVRTSGTFADRPDEGWNPAAGFLERNAEDGDLILFGTGFIEADGLSIPPDPVVFSFLSWPLTANLSPGRKYRMVALPRSEDSTAYMVSLLEVAGENRRVWVIGKGRVIDTAASALISQRRFRVREQELYGNVQVILLGRE